MMCNRQQITVKDHPKKMIHNMKREMLMIKIGPSS